MSVNSDQTAQRLAERTSWGINTVPYALGVRHTPPHGGCGCEETINSPTTQLFLMTSSYNSITGTDSANTLIGSTGADSFKLLEGDDNVLGAQANDIVDLGAGNDSVNFSADADGAEVYGQVGNDSLGLTVSFNTSTMSGGAGNDTLFVSRGISSTFQGDLGTDSLYFSDESFNNSTVYGGNTSDATSSDGADTIQISGTASASYAQGNGGNDTI